jgi:Fe2+ or Zn2+ uptake regulation protein
MIDYDHGDIVFHCDGPSCGEFIETRTSNFESAQNMLHRAHWKPRKVVVEWRHFCPDCQDAGELPMRRRV